MAGAAFFDEAVRVAPSAPTLLVGRYVTVTAQEGIDAVAASNTLRLAVAQQRTVDAGGILPLAVAVPTTVLLLAGLVARRRRRLR